jgi:hypothetical protein
MKLPLDENVPRQLKFHITKAGDLPTRYIQSEKKVGVGSPMVNFSN